MRGLAAFHALSKQGEYERLTERSESMAEYLDQLYCQFSVMAKEGLNADTMGNRAVDTARIMLEETLEWRLLYQAHATELT